MRGLDQGRIAMDTLSWVEEGPLSNEYGDFLKWQSLFVRFILGWVTQEEENDFDQLCMSMYRDLTGTKHSS